MTTPTTTTATAQLTSWTETVAITITDAPPFELPTACFGGHGPMPAPGEPFTAADMTPHAFPVGRVEIEITDGAITDQAAFPAGSTIVWRGTHDHSERNRPVDTRGVHRKHWPAWLATLVDDTLLQHDARADLPSECTNCGSHLLSWTVGPSNAGSAVDGRLRAADVVILFALGCDECSETVATLTADQVAVAMNTAHRPLREN